VNEYLLFCDYGPYDHDLVVSGFVKSFPAADEAIDYYNARRSGYRSGLVARYDGCVLSLEYRTAGYSKCEKPYRDGWVDARHMANYESFNASFFLSGGIVPNSGEGNMNFKLVVITIVGLLASLCLLAWTWCLLLGLFPEGVSPAVVIIAAGVFASVAMVCLGEPPKGKA
jgi:hypothetical protein